MFDSQIELLCNSLASPARRAASSAAQALRPFESLRRPSSWPALSQTKSPAYGETFSLAEGEGFEPSLGFTPNTISSRAPSTSSAILPITEVIIPL